MTTDHTPIEVESNGITVEKSFQRTDDDVTRVVFTVASARETPVEVELTEAIPDDVPKDELGLHPEYGRDRWTVAEDRLTYRDTVVPGGEVTTLYGVRATRPDDVDPFRTEPTLSVSAGGERVEAADDGEGADDEMASLFGSEEHRDETPSTAPGDAGTATDRAATDGGADAVDPAEALGLSRTGSDAEGDDGEAAAEERPDAGPEDGTDAGAGDEGPPADSVPGDAEGDDAPVTDATGVDAAAADGAAGSDDVGATSGRTDATASDDAGAEAAMTDSVGAEAAMTDSAGAEDATSGSADVEDVGAEAATPDSADAVGSALAAELAEGALSAADRETLREELAGTSQSLDLRLRDLQSTVQDLEVYRDALEAFIDERGDGQTVVAEFEERLDETREEVDDLSGDVEAVTERLDSVTERLANVDQRIDSVVERVEDVDDSVEAVRSDVTAVDERREADVERLGATLDSVEAAVEENAQFRERMAHAAREDTAAEQDAGSDGVTQ